MRSRYCKRRGDFRRQFLPLAHIAELKRSEAAVDAAQKRAGTRHPTVAIVWGCRCCLGYHVLDDRTVADTTVREEMRERAAAPPRLP
jgi:hypothetical protein